MEKSGRKEGRKKERNKERTNERMNGRTNEHTKNYVFVLVVNSGAVGRSMGNTTIRTGGGG